MRPLVGLICDTLPPADDPRHGVAERYLRAAPFFDADVVLLPLSAGNDASRLMARLDGIFLTGSPSNMAPVRYGATDDDAGPFDPARDTSSLALIAAADAAQRPILAVCRGFQEIAVAYGCTLRRDFSSPPHHAGNARPLAEKFAFRHDVLLQAGGALARGIGAARITVNSVHFQGVDKLAPSLRVEAVSDDGVIEAVAAPAGRVLAVQWHPEWDAPRGDEPAQRVLRMFAAMLRGATLNQAAELGGAPSAGGRN